VGSQLKLSSLNALHKRQARAGQQTQPNTHRNTLSSPGRQTNRQTDRQANKHGTPTNRKRRQEEEQGQKEKQVFARTPAFALLRLSRG